MIHYKTKHGTVYDGPHLYKRMMEIVGQVVKDGLGRPESVELLSHENPHPVNWAFAQFLNLLVLTIRDGEDITTSDGLKIWLARGDQLSVYTPDFGAKTVPSMLFMLVTGDVNCFHHIGDDGPKFVVRSFEESQKLNKPSNVHSWVTMVDFEPKISEGDNAENFKRAPLWDFNATRCLPNSADAELRAEHIRMLNTAKTHPVSELGADPGQWVDIFERLPVSGIDGFSSYEAYRRYLVDYEVNPEQSFALYSVIRDHVISFLTRPLLLELRDHIADTDKPFRFSIERVP